MNLLSKTYTLLLLSSLLVPAAEISGTVVDPDSKPVSGARIELFTADQHTQWAAIADKAGHFSFDTLKPGEYYLQATANGLALDGVEHLDLKDGENQTVDVKLALSAVQQAVTVTASDTPQTVDQVSKALDVVANEQIQQRQDYSLSDSVRLVPGVRVETLGGPGSLTDIRIRGLRAQDTSVLVDGLRLRDAASPEGDASALIGDFLITDADRIEVLRGSGSSLYGSNAIGGVLNVVTDEGGGPAHGEIQLEGGGLGLFRGAASVAGGSKDNRFEYSVGVMNLNVTQGIEGEADRTSSVQARASYRITPSLQVVARLLADDGRTILGDGPIAIPDTLNGILQAVPNVTYTPSQTDPDFNAVTKFVTGSVSLVGNPTGNWGYNVSYQNVESIRIYGNGPDGPGFQEPYNTRTDYSGNIQTLDAQTTVRLGGHNTLTGGYEFESEKFENTNTAPLDVTSNNSTDVTQRSNTVFIQDQIRLFDNRLYLCSAVRGQFFALDTPDFTPTDGAPFQGTHFAAPDPAYTGDASIAWLFRRTGTKIRAHVGRGYRAPSLYERFGAGYYSGFYSISGNPELKPEQSIAGDFGIDQSFANNRLRVSGTYFYTHLQRTIGSDPLTYVYYNTSGGLARGVELSADWAASRSLTISGAYTYTDSRLRTPIVAGVWRAFLAPEHMFNVFAVQRIGRRVFFDFALNSSSNYLDELFNNSFASGAFQFPGIHRADIGGSYTLPLTDKLGLRFFAKAQNVFDQAYYEAGYPTEGISGRGGIEFKF